MRLNQKAASLALPGHNTLPPQRSGPPIYQTSEGQEDLNLKNKACLGRLWEARTGVRGRQSPERDSDPGKGVPWQPRLSSRQREVQKLPRIKGSTEECKKPCPTHTASGP